MENDINQIEDLLNKLPKQDVDFGNAKFEVWLRVQDHIRANRQTAKSPTSGFVIWTKSKAFVTALTVVLTLGLVGGVANASKASLPGETLYPVKKATEAVQKTLAVNEEKKVKVYTKIAKTRLEEVEKLVSEKKVSADIVKQTIEDLNETTEDLHNAATVASENKPELADEAIEVAETGQNVLAKVEEQVEDEDTKQVIQNAINSSKESVDLLKAGKEKQETVKGEQTENSDETATSTTNTVTKPAVSKPDENEEIDQNKFQSEMQIDNVIETEEKETEDNTPQILDEPTL